MVRHVSMPSKGIRVGRKRIARLMRQPGVSGVTRRKFVTTMVRGDRRQAAHEIGCRSHPRDRHDSVRCNGDRDGARVESGRHCQRDKIRERCRAHTHPRLTFVDATIRSENVHFVIF
jgi:hypothetical protein